MKKNKGLLAVLQAEHRVDQLQEEHLEWHQVEQIRILLCLKSLHVMTTLVKKMIQPAS